MIRELNVYQHEAQKTALPYGGNQEKRILIAALGLCGESGEIAEKVKKLYGHGKVLEIHQMKEELGDALWYIAELATMYGFTLADIAECNIEKLRKRHGETYRQSHYTPSGSYIDDAGTHFTQ
jgi:NTP pyrophosphatase (non-canonical NTP hydrolase)